MDRDRETLRTELIAGKTEGTCTGAGKGGVITFGLSIACRSVCGLSQLTARVGSFDTRRCAKDDVEVLRAFDNVPEN